MIIGEYFPCTFRETNSLTVTNYTSNYNSITNYISFSLYALSFINYEEGSNKLLYAVCLYQCILLRLYIVFYVHRPFYIFRQTDSFMSKTKSSVSSELYILSSRGSPDASYKYVIFSTESCTDLCIRVIMFLIRMKFKKYEFLK